MQRELNDIDRDKAAGVGVEVVGSSLQHFIGYFQGALVSARGVLIALQVTGTAAAYDAQQTPGAVTHSIEALCWVVIELLSSTEGQLHPLYPVVNDSCGMCRASGHAI